MTHCDIPDLTLRIDYSLCRESLYSVLLEQGVAVRTINVDPGELIFPDTREPCLLAFLAVNADHLEHILIFGIGILKFRETTNTPYAPAAPEIEDNPFPLEIRETHFLTLRIIKGEVGCHDISGLELFQTLFLLLLDHKLLTFAHHKRIEITTLDTFRKAVGVFLEILIVDMEKSVADGG